MAEGMYCEENICDLICVGFGPAALALAITFLDKKNAYIARGKAPPLSTITFIEKYASFQWHPGMLLPGASMQISFLKDLATLRSPTSPYTFLSYLHEHDRLVTFINRSSFTPTRREYSDYLTWAADKVAQEPGVAIHYGEQAISINSDRTIVSITSVSPDKSMTRVRKGRHLVIAPGGVPRLPLSLSAIAAEATTRIIHTSVYAQRIDGIMSDILGTLLIRTPTATEGNDCVSRPVRIAIIGGGQSAAEVFLDIQSRLSKLPPSSPLRPHSTAVNHSVDLIIRRGGLKPSDSSPFTNEIFDPGATDFFFDLSSKARIDVKREYGNTNYGVVNPDTLTKIYEQIYDQRVEDGAYARGAPSDALKLSRINILKYRTVVDATQNNSMSGSSFDGPSMQDKALRLHDYMFTLTLGNVLGSDPLLETRPYDAIILATGYERCSWIDMLDYKVFGEVFGLPKSFANCDSGTLQGEEQQQEPENLGTSARVPVTPPWTAVESSSASDSSPRSLGESVSSSIQDRPPDRGETIYATVSEGLLDEVQLDLGDAHLSVKDQLALDPLPTTVAQTLPHVAGGVITPVDSQLDKVRISRTYRLLPVEENTLIRDISSSRKKFLPRVYVQGIAEETHGLSDTLLSVLSIRCGEVIDDLFEGVEAQIVGSDG